MFSPEFNQVYREAFVSATGRDFYDEDIQVEYQCDIEEVIEALLERWTDPEFDPSPITDFKETRRSQTFRVKHPETKNFTEDDAANIAQIRFFGRQVLKSAQLALLENQRIDPDDPDRFEGSNWYDAHPDEEFDESFGYHSDAPSPQRLREWPEGDYINCLGIAIAAAAESENQDAEYVFTNRLRTARYEAATRAVQFLLRVKNLCPEAIGITSVLHKFEAVLADSAGEDEDSVLKKARCIFDQDIIDYIFSHADELDTSFHHAILRKKMDADVLESDWQQIDPYGLVYSDLAPKSLDNTLSNDKLLYELGACNELLFLDGDMQDYVSQGMARAVDIALRSRKRLEKLLGDYRSPLVMEKIKTELEKSRRAMRLGFEHNEEPLNNLADELIFDRNELPENQDNDTIWISTLGVSMIRDAKAYAAYRQTYNDITKKSKRTPTSKESLEKELCEVLTQTVFSFLKNNSPLRKKFEEMILAMPLVDALRFAEEKIKESMFEGETEKAMEVGDPAFQIGSMYLNHYARWRESGIVNVAKELARVNPSQLMWQSAISQEGGEIVSDDRVAAVGALVSSLKRGQRHPLVGITRQKR